MSFLFYPKHEHGCPHVHHCPHLGSVGLVTLVSAANENEESRQYLLKTIDAERERNSRLSEENQELRTELDQVKLESKLERQNKFATNRQKQAKSVEPTSSGSGLTERKKRGAPVGHPGWMTRRNPTAGAVRLQG